MLDPNDKGQLKARKQKRKLKSKAKKVHAIAKKYASAHGLRRAFGKRWAMKVMPTVLRELMRHADISTTMKVYVGQNAEATSDAAWATSSEHSGDHQGSTMSAQTKNP